MFGYGQIFPEATYDRLACDLKRYLDWQIDSRLPPTGTHEAPVVKLEGVLTDQDLYLLEDMVTQVVNRALDPIREKLGVEPK